MGLSLLNVQVTKFGVYEMSLDYVLPIRAIRIYRWKNERLIIIFIDYDLN